MKRVLTLSCLLLTGLLFAQDAKLNKADEKYMDLEFADAISLYEDVVAGDETNTYAMLKLANCYRQINQPEQAAAWYKKSIKASDGEPVNKLYYAETLRQLEEYRQAKNLYREYLSWYPEDKRAIAGIESCDRAEAWSKRPQLFTVAAINGLNSEYNDFSPMMKGEDLVFSSDRQSAFKRDWIYGWTGNPYLDNYISKKQDDGTYSNPQLMAGPSNTSYNDGNATFSANGRLMAFTRNNYEPWIVGGKFQESTVDEVVKLKIMLTTYNPETGDWNKPFEASFNNPEYSFTHPVFSPDGKYLYFVSDMPGGFGGTDIWMAELTSDLVFKQAVNLGPVINTPGQEMFPTFGNDGTLYFSSTGHVGIGGLDVYRSVIMPNGRFGKPFNLGYPVNSSRDDFGLVMKKDSETGYFSSNRKGGKGGDDIYLAKIQGVYLELEVINGATTQPVKNAEVTIYQDGQLVEKAQVDGMGKLDYPLEIERNYVLDITAGAYMAEKVEISTIAMVPGSTRNERVILYPDYGSLIEGIVVEKQSQLPVTDARVTLINTTSGETDYIVTDNSGLFTFDILPNHEYVVKAEHKSYESTEEQLSTRGMNSKETRKVKLELGGGKELCDVKFNHIYFDYDSDRLREDASTDAQKMVQILERSADLRVEIGAHTDCRGTDAYNLNLSDRRAKSVLRYITSKGIDKDRLTFKGYGESRLVNDCRDGEECTEAQHQKNRRVEFRVIDEDGNVLCESKAK